ncbi:unnamed protein product [Danaus chrysippus]|uniref:(African queen) hypothetical protein n=1 Tax=Danaus chrysippus TaxID=151541 RepID=A0A8J2WEZ3_9NEOP|nr:unnamed protein product [Danaus chrysippus]
MPQTESARGFPFDEEEGSGAWSELASRHPDIAARLRQRPATWARKRRPSSQDGIDGVVKKRFVIADTADFGGFDRFPFDDIPPEFREHFPSHWNRRFGPRDEQFQPEPQTHQPQSPSQQTAATQTEQDVGSPTEEQVPLPQYGLRNTVDLGQKSATDPSVVDADERTQRSMSAPPDHRTVNQNSHKMSGQNQQDQHHPQSEQSSNVRHIPIFVEGRDEPVINKNVDHGTHFADTKPTYVPPPQPHIDRENYFADDGPVGFPFAKSFERPFFRQSAQPFSKQKMYPQSAFARGASPQRSQSPKPQNYQEQTSPKAETPSRQQQKPSPQQRQAPQQKATPPQQRATSPQAPPPCNQNQPPPQCNQTPPPPPQAPPANDPISQILSIQTDVLNLMTEVENFKGAKNDKQYLFLDEMLTRNLIKLDNIETEGKENIRLARKEAIKCIQKCIAVLEAKAESNAAAAKAANQAQDVEMNNPEKPNVQNGDVEMKETTKEEAVAEPQPEPPTPAPEAQVQNEEEIKIEQKPSEEKKEEVQPEKVKEPEEQPQAADTRPEEPKEQDTKQPEPVPTENVKKTTPKKTVKKRDKSKENKEKKNEEVLEQKKDAESEKEKEEKQTEEIKENVENIEKDAKENVVKSDDNKENVETMQIDSKGDSEKANSQEMEVDAVASQ